jgi:hypothetical protein
MTFTIVKILSSSEASIRACTAQLSFSSDGFEYEGREWQFAEQNLISCMYWSFYGRLSQKASSRTKLWQLLYQETMAIMLRLFFLLALLLLANLQVVPPLDGSGFQYGRRPQPPIGKFYMATKLCPTRVMRWDIQPRSSTLSHTNLH